MAGGTGLIGSHLVPALLARGHDVTILSREPARHAHGPPATTKATLMAWDTTTPAPVAGFDAVVSLTGAPLIDKAWSKARIEELKRSRGGVARRIAQGIRDAPATQRPKVLLCMSAVGLYGVWPSGRIDEQSPAATDPADVAAHVVADWEQGAREAEAHCRVVMPRLGLLLTRRGGLMGRLLPIFRLGLGGPVGSGRQPAPWIHVDDAVSALVWMLEDPKAVGAYNLVAPAHDDFKALATALGKALGRPARLPAPAVALRLRFGSRAPVILGGQDVVPARLLAAGFPFKHPDVGQAMRDLVR